MRDFILDQARKTPETQRGKFLVGLNKLRDGDSTAFDLNRGIQSKKVKIEAHIKEIDALLEQLENKEYWLTEEYNDLFLSPMILN